MSIAQKYFLKIRSFPKYTIKDVEYVDDVHLVRLIDSLFADWNEGNGEVVEESYDAETDKQEWTFKDGSTLFIEHPYQYHGIGASVSY